MALSGDSVFASDWARTLTDPLAFAHEQRCLSYAWTFLGFTTDLAKDGDWFRATLATRSVFVQRFGSELKGFENVCAHRFYPLRTKDRGNGPHRLRVSSLALRRRRLRHRHSEVPGEFRHRIARVGRASQTHRDRDLRLARLRPVPGAGEA